MNSEKSKISGVIFLATPVCLVDVLLPWHLHRSNSPIQSKKPSEVSADGWHTVNVPGIVIFNWEWNFQTENETFKQEYENFVRGAMFFFSCVRARMNFFDPRALWVLLMKSASSHPLPTPTIFRKVSYSRSQIANKRRKIGAAITFRTSSPCVWELVTAQRKKT